MQRAQALPFDGWRAMLWLVGGCAFTSMASMRICDAMLPAIAREFGVSAGQAAKVISAFTLSYGVLQLLCGPLGDRFGKVRVIGVATLMCSACAWLSAASPDLVWLIASRALSGAAAAGIIPLAMAWIGDSVDYEHRQEVLAQLLGATLAGMIAGQWVGGFMVDSYGWRPAFQVLAAIFFLSGMLLCGRVAAGLRDERGAAVGLLYGWRSVLTSRWSKVVLLVTAMEGALAFSALAFIPSDLHLRFGLSMPTAGGLVALYGVGGLVYSRCAKWVLRRGRETGLALLGGGTSAMAYFSMAFAPNWHVFVPACLLAGFGFYALHNTLQTNATQMAPWARGTAVSLFVCSLFLGQSAGVQLAAWVVDGHEAQVVFAASAIGLLVLGLAIAVMVKRRGQA